MPQSDEFANFDEPTFLGQATRWWDSNLPAVQAAVPMLSTNFFNDVTPANATENDVNSMLALKEIIGYFVIPKDVGTESALTTFVARVDTPRGQFLDLVNWYRSIGTDVLQKQQFEKIGIEQKSQQQMLLRADFVTNDVVIEESESKLIPKSFYKFAYVALPILLFLVFFISSIRLVANIVEEKSNKLADSLLANLNPIHFMDGKLWGTAFSFLDSWGDLGSFNSVVCSRDWTMAKQLRSYFIRPSIATRSGVEFLALSVFSLRVLRIFHRRVYF